MLECDCVIIEENRQAEHLAVLFHMGLLAVAVALFYFTGKFCPVNCAAVVRDSGKDSVCTQGFPDHNRAVPTRSRPLWAARYPRIEMGPGSSVTVIDRADSIIPIG